MSATIILLPGATALPVVQPQRRGRFPAGVVSLWRWRLDARIRHSEAAALDARARDYREYVESYLKYVESMRSSIAFAQDEAAALEAQARTVRQRR